MQYGQDVRSTESSGKEGHKVRAHHGERNNNEAVVECNKVLAQWNWGKRMLDFARQVQKGQGGRYKFSRVETKLTKTNNFLSTTKKRSGKAFGFQLSTGHALPKV